MESGYGHLIFLTYCTTYYALHSILASNWMKSKIPLSPQPYRLFFNFVATISLLPGIITFRNLKTVVNSDYPIWLFYLGIGYSVIGLLIILVALRNYDLREFTGLGKSKPNEKLQINGLNRYIRHPLYSGTFLLVWGIYLTSMQSSYLIVAAVTTIYIYIGTALEERKLIVHFGEEYLKYKEEVGMFVPKRMPTD